MLIGIPRETYPGERRVALVPASVAALVKAGHSVAVEAGAGTSAGFPDETYVQAGATINVDRAAVFGSASVILQVRAMGANPDGITADLVLCKEGQAIIATMDPLSSPKPFLDVAKSNVTTFALELIPRITRAQSMDVLSSQSNLAGYKAVLLAADALSKILPMMMTAAGTLAPSKVFIIGAGVAGLQAIATARRLGAVVSAYDVRPATKEQVESLGARFIQLPLTAEEASGGYARVMDEAFYAKQAELMGSVVAESDIVITTAAVPGEKAPILITREMVERMQPGSVIVDLASERGGNCEVTNPGNTITHHGVTIVGPLNVPSTLANHASQLFAKNVTTFLSNLTKDGNLNINLEDEIIRETLVTQNGQIVNPRIRERLGMPPLTKEE